MSLQLQRLPITSPSNAEFFEFLVEQLAFSLFRRSGSSLISFKETIEFVLLPEGTGEGPEEGLFYEGGAALTYGAWADLVAAFVMTSVDNRPDVGDGSPTRVYRAVEDGIAIPTPPELGRRQSPPPLVSVREELVSDRSRYTWGGAGRGPSDPGWVSLWARKIACRGADKGMPARLVFLDKLREYRRRHPAAGTSSE